MKLTKLKNKIDEALKLHDDYDVKIITDDEILEIEDCGIDSGRFNFNIEVDVPVVYEECNEYHIEDDIGIEYCSICVVYHSAEKECPGCELNKIKESVKKTLLSF